MKTIRTACLLGLLLLPLYSTAQDTLQVLQQRAEQGDADAQHTLGRMYATGEGVLQDYKQAVYWSQKAAEQGNTKAQYNLG
ncbi:MAG: tetratricopeptide repeat protein, partial [Sphingobacteriia bacterium]